MPIELTQLTSLQVQNLPRGMTVFFFPVGGVEDHGPHLPLGLDLAEAHRLCFLAAQKLEADKPGWKGIVMPQAPFGVDSNTTTLAVTVRGYVLRDWLVDSCRGLTKLGFLHFVCFSGQCGPRQLTAIEEAGKIVSRRTFWSGIVRLLTPRAQGGTERSLVSACSALIRPNEVRRAPFFPFPSEHGGARDTSIAQALGVIPSPEVGVLDWKQLPEQAPQHSVWKRLRGQVSGYWGAPASATRDQGERALVGTVDEVFAKLCAVWEGANPDHVFRSWYSVLAPNKSFFKAWVLGFGIFIILGAWVYLSIETLLSN